MKILGVDTGGTFTDFVLTDGQALHIHKRLSTPAQPEQAILQGISALGLDDDVRSGNLYVIHGTTVATNAALEGKGVKTVFITNHGFADMLSIGRQNRRELYNLTPRLQAPPVPAELCLETGGRRSARGELLEPLTDDDITRLRKQVAASGAQAVAINLLFSFLNSEEECRIETALQDLCFVSRSSDVLAEYKEYERGIATWLNAWLGPIVQAYLQRLQQALAPCQVSVMQSSGGTISAGQASRRAARLLLSGPAGGLAAARFIGEQMQQQRLLTFDMGGTSTDVALLDGHISLTSEGRISHYPVAIPMVNMHTIGAGGGSIAYLDAGGILQLGPQSAGANPGPACYGQGGTLPTTTDANAVLGRLGSQPMLGGYLPLDIEAARRAINILAEPLGLSIEATAEGIIAIANEHMTAALRVISVEKGQNPADFVLYCFGGAGGLHLCDIAEQLGIRTAIVPVHGGVLSALGMLVAPKQRQLSRTVNHPLTANSLHALQPLLQQMAESGKAELIEENVSADSISQEASLDLRYKGQSFTLNIPLTSVDEIAEAFHQSHQQHFGHRLPLAIEIVNIRLALNANSQHFQLPQIDLQETHAAKTFHTHRYQHSIPQIRREYLPNDTSLNGPAIILEDIATTFVKEGWSAQQDSTGNLHLKRQ